MIPKSRAVARTLIGGGGGGKRTFIYSGSARLTSFEINFISKETSRTQLEYMNIHPPINALATALPKRVLDIRHVMYQLKDEKETFIRF